MTHRIYLAAARFADGPPQQTDLPVERVFIHAAGVSEIWVETESQSVPEAGKAVSFALSRPLDLGFERITGTVERKIRKQRR